MTVKIMLSVIVPFHNEIELIRRAVDSVLANITSYVPIEIIICNDGNFSEDQIRFSLGAEACKYTKIVTNAYAKGPGGARNTGLDVSVGSYIAFLDADDIWLPGKVKAQMMEAHAGATFVATAYQFEKNHLVVQPPASINNAMEIFLRRGIGTSTVMISRNLLSDLRFKDIRFSQDIDFW